MTASPARTQTWTTAMRSHCGVTTSPRHRRCCGCGCWTGAAGLTPLRFDYAHTKRDQVETLTRYSDLAGTTQVGRTDSAYDAGMRLTNLQKLNVDTSWYVRYRSPRSPDLGATFPQAVTIHRQPAIPLSDLQKYVGRYGATGANDFAIFIRNQRLAVRLPNNTSFDLLPPDASGRRATRGASSTNRAAFVG